MFNHSILCNFSFQSKFGGWFKRVFRVFDVETSLGVNSPFQSTANVVTLPYSIKYKMEMVVFDGVVSQLHTTQFKHLDCFML